MASLPPFLSPARILHLEDSLADAELIRVLIHAEWPGCQIRRVETRQHLLTALRE